RSQGRAMHGLRKAVSRVRHALGSPSRTREARRRRYAPEPIAGAGHRGAEEMRAGLRELPCDSHGSPGKGSDRLTVGVGRLERPKPLGPKPSALPTELHPESLL